MATISKSFLNKIYDAYEKVDYEITDDNLNPLREVSFYDTFDIEKLETEARMKLKAKVSELRKSLIAEGALGVDDLNRVSSMRPNESFNRGNSLRDFLNLQKVGSVTGTKFNLNNMSLDSIMAHDPLVNEIDDMMITLLNPLYGTSTNEGVDSSLLDDNYNFDFNIDFFLPGIAPFGPMCQTNTGDDSDGNGNGPDGTMGSNEDNLGKVNDDNYASSLDDGIDKDALADQIRREEEAKAFLDGLKERGNEDAMSLKQCALSSLGILKVIAIILTIIQVYRIIVTYIVAILVQVSELVMLAAGIWINPTNIATIISKMLQVVMALLARILAEIIQMLLDMINADCLVQNSLNTLGQINKSMSMGAKAVRNTKKAISFTQDSYKLVQKKAKEAWDKVKEAAERAKSLTTHDFVGDIKGQTLDTFKKGIESGANLAVTTLKKHGLTQDILNTLRDTASSLNDLTSASADLMGLDFTAAQEKVDTAMSNIEDVMAL